MKSVYREKLKKTWTDWVTIERDSWTRYSSGTFLGERAVLNTTAGIGFMEEFKQICR
jgi:hypothetical protein